MSVHRYLSFELFDIKGLSYCLVKEDEDAVRNNLAGDANLVVKKIPEFPPRQPHFHPVHMLHKIFWMTKNAPPYFTVSFSWIADSRAISVLLKFTLFAMPSKESLRDSQKFTGSLLVLDYNHNSSDHDNFHGDAIHHHAKSS